MIEIVLWALAFLAAGSLAPIGFWLESRKDDPW